jgi:hypothetical protein
MYVNVSVCETHPNGRLAAGASANLSVVAAVAVVPFEIPLTAAVIAAGCPNSEAPLDDAG